MRVFAVAHTRGAYPAHPGYSWHLILSPAGPEASLSMDGAQVHAKRASISEPPASKTRVSMAVPISADQPSLPASSPSLSPTITENLHFTQVPSLVLVTLGQGPSPLTDAHFYFLPIMQPCLVLGSALSPRIFSQNLLVPSHFLTHLKAPPAQLGSMAPPTGRQHSSTGGADHDHQRLRLQ